jgi:uncharacterized SAM-binding protein YcdF (DUF218 family)
MFFYLSKALWWLFEPGNILLLLMCFGVVFLWLNKPRKGKFFCTLALVYYGFFGILPIGLFLLDQLENRFPIQESLPKKITGIIILGGVVDVLVSEQRSRIALNGNVERVTSLIALTRRYPDATVVFTGGAGLIGRPDLVEADIVRPLLNQFVIHPENLVYESKSRNTYENGIFTKEIIQPKPDDTWLLVTSAIHMPRAVGVFRHQGINVTPYPVDFKQGGNRHYELSLNPREGLGDLRAALHEWLGLFAYYITDKTSEIFPAP